MKGEFIPRGVRRQAIDSPLQKGSRILNSRTTSAIFLHGAITMERATTMRRDMQSEFAAKIFGDRENPHVRLQKMFDDYSTTVGVPPKARTWAAAVLAKSRIDPRQDPDRAVTALRRAYPRLTNKAARFLVDDALMR